MARSVLLLGAVGHPQFEVVARWVTAGTKDGAAADERELKRSLSTAIRTAWRTTPSTPTVMLEWLEE